MVTNSFSAPKSLAVIGASQTPGKIGYVLVNNLIKSGYEGKIYPVHPKAKEILGIACYPAMGKIPGEVETAVFAVPAAKVLDIAEECGRKGVKNLVVLTAGFKETGREEPSWKKAFWPFAAGMTCGYWVPTVLVSLIPIPQSMPLFSRDFLLRGASLLFLKVSMLAAVLDWSMAAGIGYSKIYSLGNKADINEVDCIVEAAADPNTKVIICYLEDVACGSEFLKVLAEVTCKKPVIVLKSAQPGRCSGCFLSYRGLAGSELAYDVAFKRCGVLRANSMSELFDLASLFVNQPIPRGKRVAVITNAGGPGIIATDKIEESSLSMARFTKETIDELRLNLPSEAGIYNPVDVLGDAKADRFQFALEKVLQDENVDSVVVLLCPVAVTQPVETARAMIELNRAYPDKPLIASYMGAHLWRKGQKCSVKAVSLPLPCQSRP
ncbi:MAG: CoA-binding protein [Candidatus Syntrophopropionicum ammoniitolerans]